MKKEHIKPCICKTCLKAKKAEYEKGFIDGSDITGRQAKEIHACERQEIIEMINKIDVSGGGSGRRLIEQIIKILK